MAGPLIFQIILSIWVAQSYAQTSCTENQIFDESSNQISSPKEGEIAHRSSDENPSADQRSYPENADHVGFCSNYSSRDLLHQAFCQLAPKDCFQPAVTDFMVADGKLNENDFGKMANTTYALQKILSSKAVSTEACLPFGVLFKPIDATFGSYEKKARHMTRDVIINECRKEKTEECNCSNAPDSVDELLKIADDCELIESSKHRLTFLYSAFNRLKKDKNCATKVIPSFDFLTTYYNPTDIHDSSLKLNAILKSGNQVKVETSSPHGLVVSNYRVKCIGGTKTLQYQTLDSLYGTPWSSASSPGDWMDGNQLLRELDPHSNFQWLRPSGFLGFSYDPLKYNRDHQAPMQVEVNSRAYKAGLRSGTKVLGYDVNAETGTISVRFLAPSGATQEVSYKSSD